MIGALMALKPLPNVASTAFVHHGFKKKLVFKYHLSLLVPPPTFAFYTFPANIYPIMRYSVYLSSSYRTYYYWVGIFLSVFKSMGPIFIAAVILFASNYCADSQKCFRLSLACAYWCNRAVTK